MKKVSSPRIIEAINRNMSWIKRMCAIHEFNPEKQEDLIQDVLCALYGVRDDFNEETVKNPDGWIKQIACNVACNHIRKEKLYRNEVGFDEEPTDHSNRYASEKNHDLKILLNYIRENFSDRDREMMYLDIIKETHKDIAAIIGLEVRSVTNRLSLLKKELSEFLNKGATNE